MQISAHVALALVKAQRAFAPALKTSANPAFKSRYADLAACVDAVIDALNSNGLFLHQTVETQEASVTVRTVFIHESGDCMDCGAMCLPVIKKDPQGFGSAITYARRYSLMASCGIAPEDDDGNAASGLNGKPTARPAPAPQTVQRISTDQAGQLQYLLEYTGSNLEGFLKYMGVAALDQLPASRFADAKAALDKKAKQREDEGRGHV